MNREPCRLLCLSKEFLEVFDRHCLFFDCYCSADSGKEFVIYSTVNSFPIEKTLDYALAAGIAAVGHEKTINPNMSVSLIESILKEYAL